MGERERAGLEAKERKGKTEIEVIIERVSEIERLGRERSMGMKKVLHLSHPPDGWIGTSRCFQERTFGRAAR